MGVAEELGLGSISDEVLTTVAARWPQWATGHDVLAGD